MTGISSPQACWRKHRIFPQRLRTLGAELANARFLFCQEGQAVPPVQRKQTMGKGSNVVHQYFKRDFEGYKVLVKVNPISLVGVEITRFDDGRVALRDLEFDEQIADDLRTNGFEEASPLEFNLYLSGLA
jgi:hypothetical protein